MSTRTFEDVSFPRLSARTRNFSLGAPRTVAVSADGERVVFLRSTGPTDPVHALWVLDVTPGTERIVADPRALLDAGEENLPPEEKAMRERRRESGGGIVAYATDEASRVAVFTLGGRLFRIGLLPGDDPTPDELPVAGPVLDPRPSPAGDRVAYVTGGALHVLERPDGDGWTDRELVAEAGVTWGQAEFAAAEEMSRFRGYWWAPDSERILAARVDESPVGIWHIADPASPARPATTIRYPQAGTDNALVSLHVLAVSKEADRLDLSWEADAYPYVVTAGWDDSGCPLFTVMDRRQTKALVLGADPETGELTTHADVAGEPWLEVLPGTPALLSDGRLIWSSDAGDARRLLVGGQPASPPGLYVRRYLGREENDLLIEAVEDAPEQSHVYRLAADGSARRVTDGVGWFGTISGGVTTVEIRRTLDAAGVTYAVRRGGAESQLASHAAPPPFLAQPALSRVTERRLPTAVVYPRGHVPGTPLPVLMDPYGGPHHQEIVAAGSVWLEPQWWADQGFAVVIVDGRGTPGVRPSFEYAIHLDVAGPVLDDQVDALRALAADHPDLDLSRVGIRGWSFGGYLAALAVLRRPDVFHAAVAGAPVTAWELYDTFYTERYLGLPDEQPDAYARTSLLTDAAQLDRPLLLVHGLADDNVVAAHTLQLSSALLAAGRPHDVLPLTGITHMASDETVRENLLLLQLDFLRKSLRF